MAKKKVKKKKSSKKKSTKKSSRKSDEHGKSKGLAAKLKKFKKGWKEAEISEFSDVPDGKYAVRINSAKMTETKDSGIPMATFDTTVLAGKQKNRKIFKNSVLNIDTNPRCLSFLKSDLNRLGVEMPEDPIELIDVLPELDGTLAEVLVKTTEKGGEAYTNVYFQKGLDEDDVDDEDLEEEEEEESDDDESDEDDDSEEDEDESDEEDEEESDEEDEYEPEKGGRTVVDFDGEDFAGKITSINEKAGTANVKFDDGSSEKVDISDLQEEESDEEDDSVVVDEEESDEEDEDEGDIEIKFNDKKLKAEDKKAIKKLAKANEFDPADYESLSEMLADIGDYFAVTGTFKAASALLKAIKKAA